MSHLLSARLQNLQHLIEQDTENAVTYFWAEIEQYGAPIIEPAQTDSYFVTFLWRDNQSTRSVDVIQDWDTDGIREHPMVHMDEAEFAIP